MAKNAKKTKATKKAKKGMVAVADTFAPMPGAGTIKGNPAFDSSKIATATSKAQCQAYAAEAAAAGMSFFADPCAAFNQTPSAPPPQQGPALSMATPGTPTMANAKLTKYLAKAAPGLAGAIGGLAGASAGLQSFLGDVASGVASAFGAEEMSNIPTDDETSPYFKTAPVQAAEEWIKGIPNVAVVIGAAALGYLLFFRRK